MLLLMISLEKEGNLIYRVVNIVLTCTNHLLQNVNKCQFVIRKAEEDGSEEELKRTRNVSRYYPQYHVDIAYSQFSCVFLISWQNIHFHPKFCRMIIFVSKLPNQPFQPLNFFLERGFFFYPCFAQELKKYLQRVPAKEIAAYVSLVSKDK